MTTALWRHLIGASLGALALAAIALGTALAGVAGSLLAAGIVVAVAMLLAHKSALTRLERARALARPFPEAWRHSLELWCDHYARLPGAERRRFEKALIRFVHGTRITGVDIEIGDDVRLMVAASAVCLSFEWSSFEWTKLGEVLVYPEDFDRDYGYEDPELAGQTNAWGTILLSLPALEDSFADPSDGFHVGFHEFAHLLDVEQAEFNGLPKGLSGERLVEWERVRDREMGLVRAGRSALDPYAANDPVEFFPVAVEAFLERPVAVASRHPALYALLRDYLGQDPARWERERRAPDTA